VWPRWAPRLIETNRIGAHIFYRYPSAAERATMPEWNRPSRRPQVTTVAAEGLVEGVIAGEAAAAPLALEPAPLDTPAALSEEGLAPAPEAAVIPTAG
jgi:hypothetical protein